MEKQRRDMWYLSRENNWGEKVLKERKKERTEREGGGRKAGRIEE